MAASGPEDRPDQIGLSTKDLSIFDQAWAGSKDNLRTLVNTFLELKEANLELSREIIIAGMADWVEDNCGHRVTAEMLVTAVVQLIDSGWQDSQSQAVA